MNTLTLYQASLYIGAIDPDHGPVRMTVEQAIAFYGPDSRVGRILSRGTT